MGLLTLIFAVQLLALFHSPDENLHIIACDVGQGDAILVVYGQTQILVDGGPGRGVVDCLTTHMPFTDKKIEAIILSHPQKDHYGGLIDVLNAYEVGVFIATPLDSSSQDYQVLKEEVGGKGVRVVNPDRGMVIRFGLIQLEILHPSAEYILSESVLVDESKKLSGEDVLGAYTTNKDPNDFSVVAVLKYKDFDALLTGDIGPEISDQIAKSLSLGPKVEWEYIKIPHHGSKNGLSGKLLDAVSPQVAVISAGKNNSYGHPHQEIIKMLSDKGVRILRTDEGGDVEVVTDGEKIYIR